MKYIKKLIIISLCITSLNAGGHKLYFANTKDISYPKANEYSATLIWLEVKVPTNDGRFKTFKIMSRPVSEKDFLGYGSDKKSISEINLEMANNFCMQKYSAIPSNAYVFEYARRDSNFTFSNNTKYEMIAPVDYEELDEVFYQDGDYLEVGDALNLIVFHKKKKTYHPKTINKKLKKTSFRCMQY